MNLDTRTSLATLDGYRSGEHAWYWFAEQGFRDSPELWVLPVERDPEGEAFGAAIERASNEGGIPRGVRSMGTLEFSAAGPIFHSESPESGLLSRLALWSMAHPDELRRLSGASHAQIDGQRIERETLWGALLPPDLQPAEYAAVLSAAAALRHLRSGQSLVLVVLAEGPHTRLLLRPQQGDTSFEHDCHRLAAGTPDPRWISAVLTCSGGRLALHAREGVPNFLPRLARWVDANIRWAPILQRLCDVSLHAGDTVHEDPKLWRFVRPPVPMAPWIREAARITLDAATPGDRLLYWFSPQSVDGAPALFLSPADDADTHKHQLSQHLGPDSPARPATSGAAKVNANGQLRFVSTRSSPSFLADLAAVAETHGLAGLTGSAFRVLGEGGAVLDQQAWPSQTSPLG